MGAAMTVLVNFLAVVVALFVFWRRLKEDYDSKEIFATASYILLASLLGVLATQYWLHSFAFLTWATGGFIGLVAGVRRFKLRFYETFEAYILAILYLLGLVALGGLVLGPSFASLYKLFALWVLVVFYHVLNANYHNFSWYASGRAGFAGLTAAGVGLLARVVAVLAMPAGFIAAGKSEALVDGTLSFVFFLLVFNLSRTGK